MKKDDSQSMEGAKLRRLAEERLRCRPAEPPGPPSEADMLRLIHELQVHQIELELQNEELTVARTEVEAGLARYTDLYDFAPTAYFTLAGDGTILAVNLTGARLVGIERAHLLRRRFALLLTDADRPILTAFLDKIFSGITREFAEVALPREGMTTLFVRFEAMLAADGQTCRAAVLDITERRSLEEQRDRLITDLQESAAKVKQLKGLLPICSYCKKIHDDQGYWEQLEAYFLIHSDVLFSHGICPSCMTERYPEVNLETRSVRINEEDLG